MMYYETLSQSGAMSEADAKKTAKGVILQLHYQVDGYYWINDNNGVIVVHPIDPSYEGKSFTDFKDKNGDLCFKPIMDHISNKENDFFVEYTGPRKRGTNFVKKLSYVKHLDKWGWYIGSGLYEDDIEKQINGLANHYAIIYAAFVLVSFVGFIVLIFPIANVIDKINDNIVHIINEKYDFDVEHGSTEEMGLLAENIEKLRDKLKDQNSKPRPGLFDKDYFKI